MLPAAVFFAFPWVGLVAEATIDSVFASVTAKKEETALRAAIWVIRAPNTLQPTQFRNRSNDPLGHVNAGRKLNAFVVGNCVLAQHASWNPVLGTDRGRNHGIFVFGRDSLVDRPRGLRPPGFSRFFILWRVALQGVV